MQKMIEVTWEGNDGAEHSGEAIVEYIEICDPVEGELRHVEREITGVFLPEYIPQEWQAGCRQQAIEQFHKSN